MPGFVDLLSILMCMTSLIWVKLIIERNEIYKIWTKYSIDIEFFSFLEKQWTSKEQNMFFMSLFTTSPKPVHRGSVKGSRGDCK